MCTKEDAKMAVREVLEEKSSEGLNVIEQELLSSGDRVIRNLTLRFGGALLVAVVGGTLMWGNLVFRVQNVEEKMNEGGRYTKEQSIEDKARQVERDAGQDVRIAEIREDLSKQLSDFSKKLDQMQELLYQIARDSSR